MREENISIPLSVYESVEQLPSEIKNLMKKAEGIREHAYSPYSRFKVGAAVLLSNGEVVLGSNQENAAFPSGLCAERVAVFAAGANFPNQTIRAIAITARAETRVLEEPIAPCGSCRQSIAEYEQKQQKPIEIYFMGEKGIIYKLNSIADLLPLSFSSKYL